MSEIDFTRFEKRLAENLEAWGFRPELLEEGVETGFPLFAVFRKKCSIATVAGEESLASLAIEIRSTGVHPIFGRFDFLRKISLTADSPETALIKAGDMYATSTLSALLATMTEEYSTGFESTDLEALLGVSNSKLVFSLSLPFVSSENEATDAIFNQLVEYPLFRFLPNVMNFLSARRGPFVLDIDCSKLKSGSMTAELLLNGTPFPEAVEEFGNRFSDFSANWDAFDVSQTCVILPQEAVEEEQWRIDSLDPVSDPAHESAATCSVDQKFEPAHYFLNSSFFWGIKFLSVVLLVPAAISFLLKWTIAGCVFLGLWTATSSYILYRYSKLVSFLREKFKYTLLTPGVVFSVSPLRVLVLAPLAKSRFAPDRGDSFRILEDPRLPGHLKVLGERIPIASSFVDGGDPAYWADFSPDPVCWGVSNDMGIRQSIEKLPEADWQRLETYVASKRIPRKFKGILLATKLPPPVPER